MCFPVRCATDFGGYSVAWPFPFAGNPSKPLTIPILMTSQERRVFQRLKLAKPILGTMDGHSALILDIGVGGAFIEHRGRAREGLKIRLGFRWQGSELSFDSEVNRSEVVREGGEEGIVSHSAISFTHAHGDSEEKLEEMMATFVSHVLAAHRGNASAD